MARTANKKLLDEVGVVYEFTDKFAENTDLIIIGREAKYNDAQLQTCMDNGGKVLFLSRNASDHGFGTTLELVNSCSGSRSIPDWPECRGLSISDMRWRAECPAWLLKSGPEIGADGLLGCLRKGRGVALFCQIDPDRFNADTKTFFRFTRWRQTRALAQILANLGAVFSSDKPAVSFAKQQSVYHPDYRDYSTPFADDDAAKFQDGDDPYRYFRW